MAAKLDPATLPDSARERSVVLEERSRPDPNRPQLSTELGAELASVEVNTARGYATVEDETFRLYRIAARLRGRRKNGLTGSNGKGSRCASKPR